jgi:DNA (cytosine-5)-methyltransferase 1
VFTVACFDPRAERLGPVLADPEGSGRRPHPRPAEGTEVAGTLGGGAPGRGSAGAVVNALDQRRGGVDDNEAQAGHLVLSTAVIAFHGTQTPISAGHALPLEQAARAAAVLTDTAVRRLTPRERERLMGWPDDWTRWTDDGREIADSHRERMTGNGVVSPCAEWVGRRIAQADARLEERAA